MPDLGFSCDPPFRNAMTMQISDCPYPARLSRCQRFCDLSALRGMALWRLDVPLGPQLNDHEDLIRNFGSNSPDVSRPCQSFEDPSSIDGIFMSHRQIGVQNEKPSGQPAQPEGLSSPPTSRPSPRIERGSCLTPTGAHVIGRSPDVGV
jgi:hypothetical protein